MLQVYSVSDRAIQIDCPACSVPDLLALSNALSLSLSQLKWPAFQLIQADQSVSLLFAKPPSGELSLSAMLPVLNGLIAKLQKSARVPERAARHHTILVNYGGTAGQDLDWVASQIGLSTVELIALHSNAIYTVDFLGFLPGFAYLSGLPEVLHLPRRSSPRARVPAGTLAIGARYCAVYPWESPGGWHLLGHVEQVLFDPEAATANGRCLFHAGDTVQFIRADHA
jgi:5-oxoprolinase (ATP-hydrolysing) subunit B